MNNNFKVIGLNRLGNKPNSAALEADDLTTRPSELIKVHCFFLKDDSLIAGNLSGHAESGKTWKFVGRKVVASSDELKPDSTRSNAVVRRMHALASMQEFSCFGTFLMKRQIFCTN